MDEKKISIKKSSINLSNLSILILIKFHQVSIPNAVKKEVVEQGKLVEIGNALARSNRSAAVAFINSCYATRNVKVVSVDSALLRHAINFYHSRKDKEWGLTDCISFIVMKDHGLTEALTNDKHFQQAGFRALLREDV